MRISDWSSDVCSSDLCPLPFAAFVLFRRPTGRTRFKRQFTATPHTRALSSPEHFCFRSDFTAPVEVSHGCKIHPQRQARRSEEHTSELQSLMRNSYAVLCLKKKKITHNKYTRQ